MHLTTLEGCKEALYDNMHYSNYKTKCIWIWKYQLNPMFEDFAKHCGFKIRVCKPYRAKKQKVKVEKIQSLSKI